MFGVGRFTQEETNPNKDLYFRPSRKGEISELKAYLRRVIDEEEDSKRLAGIQRVIVYMTMGYDMSQLLPEMVLCSHSPNIKERKLVSFFLANYSCRGPDIALMATNTFLKGCNHSNDLIRRYSLKALAQMSSPTSQDFIRHEALNFIADPHPEVRRAAFLSSLKYLLNTATPLEENSIFIDKLYEGIRDPDSVNSCNCVLALERVLSFQGGIVLSSKLANYLFARLKQYPDYLKAHLLATLFKYNPRSEQEAMDILNRVDQYIDSSSSAVALAAIRILLCLAKGPKTEARVNQRIGLSLIRLLTFAGSRKDHELEFVLARTVEYFVKSGRTAKALSQNYRTFFSRNQPMYVSAAKLQVLPHLTGPQNIADVLYELNQMAKQGQFSALAVQAMRSIGLLFPSYSELIVKHIALLFASPSASRSVVALRDLLFQRPSLIAHVEHLLFEEGSSLYSDQSSKSAFLGILLAFGHKGVKAQHILDDLVEEQSFLAESSQQYKRTLLAASVVCYLRDPVEGFNSLSTILARMLGEKSHPTTKRKALFYLKLLKNKRSALKAHLEQIDFSSFKNKKELVRKQIDSQFDRLELVFGVDQDNFTRTKEQIAVRPLPSASPWQVERTPETVEQGEPLLEEALAISYQYLSEYFALSPEEYQERWEGIADGARINRLLRGAVLGAEDLGEMCGLWRVHVIASGEEGGRLKLYCYAGLGTILLLAELRVEAGVVTVVCKCSEEEKASSFMRYIEEMLRTNDMI